MVNEEMEQFASRLTSEGGLSPDLIAMLKMDEIIDRWSLLISASWINENNRHDEFQKIVILLQENVDHKLLHTIARIGLLAREDHLVQELTKIPSGEIIKEAKINGNFIHEGYIISSNNLLESV